MTRRTAAALGLVLAVGAGTAVVSQGASDRSAPPSARSAAVPVPTVNRFDASAAYTLASQQVAVGPRPAGSAKSAALAEYLRQRLPNGRFEAVPGGLRNVVGHLPGQQPAIVIGAHYDTAAIPNFVGANDGASGTAAVVELARSLGQHRLPGGHELRFVLFDGEENPPGSPPSLEGFLANGMRGSKAYVAAHRTEVHRMILLDMVGDRDLSFPRENGSHKGLWTALRQAANRVGVVKAFPDKTRNRIYDDHYPFTKAGIPAIDIIDFTFPWFHTTGDTLDKISASSLDVAGEAVVELTRGL